MPVFKSFPFLSVFLFLFVFATAQDCLIENVEIRDLRHDRALLAWNFADGEDFDIEVEYDSAGFTLGSGFTENTSDSLFMLTNLRENYTYEFYLNYTCAASNTTIEAGPFLFTTRFARDGSVAEVLPMLSGCNLDPDSVRFLLRNEGGLPMSLVEVNYRLNDRGEDPSYPVDGLYTGLLGTDSSDIYAFDSRNVYPEPGDYEYEIWISWERDQNPGNDTARYLVTNAPVIDALPYSWDFEAWSGGWHADALNLDSAYWQRRGSEPEVAAFDGNYVWGGRDSFRFEEQIVSSLLSPCYDFSDMDNDPIVKAALYSDNFLSSDHVLILEYTLDEGDTWNRIPRSEISVNWNTGRNNEVWNRPIDPGNWSIAETLVPGLAGEDQVQFRWQYFRVANATGEGWLLDRIEITESQNTDLALSPIIGALKLNCSENLIMDFSVRNLGTTEVNGFTLEIELDNAPVFSQNYAINLAPLTDTVISVDLGRASNFPGQAMVSGEVILAGDEDPSNNLISQELSFYPVTDIPVREDFFFNEVPEGWLVNGGELFPFNSARRDVLFKFLSPGESWSVITSEYGPLTDNNELILAFNWADDEGDLLDLGPTDTICLYISTDCLEESRELLQSYHAGNYDPIAPYPSDTFDLSDYAGEQVLVELEFKNNSGDSIQASLDYFSIRGCPGELDIDADIQAEKNGMDGEITLFVSNVNRPFRLEWSDTSTTSSIRDSLVAGDYTVTITDTLGCTAVRSFTVDSCDNELDISFNVSRDEGGNLYNGFIEISSIEGDLSDYEITWSNGFFNVPGIYFLPNERYRLKIEDQQGCEYIYSFDLNTTNQDESPELEDIAEDFLLYPNPSNGVVYLRTDLRASELLELQVLDPFSGAVIHRRSLEPGSRTSEDLKIDQLRNGMNIVIVKTKKQVYSFKVVVQRN